MNLKKTIRKILKESMKVDDWGRLHVEEEKILYPYKKISKFVNWFQKEWGDYATKQGWAIFDSDTEISHQKYKFEPSNKFMSVFQVQRLDSPSEGEALFGRLKNDYAADDLAKKLGLMLDEFGIVIGWDGESFLEDNNLKESSKRILREELSSSNDVVIFVAGLETQMDRLNQSQILKNNLPTKRIITHGYNDSSGVIESIRKYPNAFVVLFSKGCELSSTVASVIRNKSKLFIVEPYAPSGSRTKTLVNGAVSLGVPNSNVIYGPNNSKQKKGYRGEGVVVGATKNTLGGHFTALKFVCNFIY